MKHTQQELSCCWDGRAMLQKSNFCFRVGGGIPLFNASLSESEH